MAAFQRGPHQFDVADAFEGVVAAADLVGWRFGEVDEIGHEIGADLLRIDEMRHAEALAPLLLVVVGVDADDHVGPGEAKALDHVQPDAAQPEHRALRAGRDLGGVDHRADACRDATADVTNLVEWRILANFRHRNLGQTVKLAKVDLPM